MLAFLAVLSSLAALTVAKNVTVQVGGSTGGFIYSPETVTADVGDNIIFSFDDGAHTVTQSTFDTPCSPVGSGFNTGRVLSQQVVMPITSDTPSPFWYHCATGPHCKLGMVGAINVPSGGSQTFAAFKAAAMGGSASGTNGSASAAPVSSAAASATNSVASAAASASQAVASAAVTPQSGASSLASLSMGLVALLVAFAGYALL